MHLPMALPDCSHSSVRSRETYRLTTSGGSWPVSDRWSRPQSCLTRFPNSAPWSEATRTIARVVARDWLLRACSPSPYKTKRARMGEEWPKLASAPTGAVFLSDASQDADAAQRICDALRAAGVEVWFDWSKTAGRQRWGPADPSRDPRLRAFIMPVCLDATTCRSRFIACSGCAYPEASHPPRVCRTH